MTESVLGGRGAPPRAVLASLRTPPAVGGDEEFPQGPAGERVDLGPDALGRFAQATDTLRAISAGEVDAFVISASDAAQHVRFLADADKPYRTFVENMRDGAATLSTAGLILFANRRFAELVGRLRESLIGSSFASLVATGSAPIHHWLADPEGTGGTFEMDLTADNGVAVPVLVGSSHLDLDGDRLVCLTFTDLSAQKAQARIIDRLSRAQGEQLVDLQDAQVALTRQATHDGLTGLANRALLIDRLNQALSHAQRSHALVAVLYVDLDGFKQINDSQGHASGDEVLRWVAGRVGSLLRPMDTVARVGGDEFIVLIPDIDSNLHAIDVAARVVAELRRPREPLVSTERISASVGVTVSVGGRGSAEALIHEADTAMYQAKKLGGDRARPFDAELGRQAELRSTARRTLQSALAEGRTVVVYQPIVNLSTGLLDGFEALARIVDSDGAIVPPSAFIPVAEESGLIVPLGSEVMRLACKHAGSWPTDKEVSIAVNLSSRQFEPGDLVSLVSRELERNGVSPQHLHLELTETAIIDLRPDVINQLTQLRELGIEIGLDDFGTGYASLTHLRRLPVTFIKIDQTFVQGLGRSGEDDRIVASMVDLATSLGLRSIGEGVETATQLERLRELGCDHAQGYLLARPLASQDTYAAIDRTDWIPNRQDQ